MVAVIDGAKGAGAGTGAGRATGRGLASGSSCLSVLASTRALGVVAAVAKGASWPSINKQLMKQAIKIRESELRRVDAKIFMFSPGRSQTRLFRPN